MENLTIPSSFIGAAVFFGLLAMVAWLLIRETLRIVLKPALVLLGLAMVAVWMGVLDGTALGGAFAWVGDQLVTGAGMAAEWATDAFEGSSAPDSGEA